MLVTAATDARGWVYGELSVTPRQAAQLHGVMPALSSHARELQTAPSNFKLFFDVGLNTVTISVTRPSAFQNTTIYYESRFDRSMYIADLNAGSQMASCSQGFFNLLCGFQPLPQSAFNATFGLLIFSAILSCAAWLGMQARAVAKRLGCSALVPAAFAFPSCWPHPGHRA